MYGLFLTEINVYTIILLFVLPQPPTGISQTAEQQKERREQQGRRLKDLNAKRREAKVGMKGSPVINFCMLVFLFSCYYFVIYFWSLTVEVVTLARLFYTVTIILT